MERGGERAREPAKKPTIYPHTQKVSVSEVEEQHNLVGHDKGFGSSGRGVGIYSRPVLRVSRGVKPMSLAQLKNVDKEGNEQKISKEGEKKLSQADLAPPRKQGVNLDELKKVMQEAEGLKKAVENKETPEKETKDSKNNKKIISPGEAVKF